MASIEPGRWGVFVLGLLLLGAGFGLCITPATVAILRSVPAAKQGVASAVNDAVREVGAALGIAVAGSMLATGYVDHLGPAVAALPGEAREATRASLVGAYEAQAALGPKAAPALAEARSAFLAGLHLSFLTCAIFSAVCAVAVAVTGPGRVRQAEPRTEGQGRSSAAGASAGTAGEFGRTGSSLR
jgi:fucose permease